MSQTKHLTYHRPKTIEAALELLATGVPLAGGTAVTPNRRQYQAVVDLAELEMNEVSVTQDSFTFGAAVKLQALLEASQHPLPALAKACRREAGRNMRNQATLMGAVHSGDGRSPLLTALLALNPLLTIAPGNQTIGLDKYLDQREPSPRSIITQLRFQLPAALGLEQVGRTPLDRPHVLAAAARFADGTVNVAIGGFGGRPSLLPNDGVEAEALASAAADAYAEAGDEWASAAYRSAAVAVLVRRVSQEVMGA